MASPHAVGVAALIVSRYGHPDPQRGGLELVPHQTEKILMRTATPHACPTPPVLDYTNVGRPADVHGDVRRHRRGEQHLGHRDRRRPDRGHRPQRLIALAGRLGASAPGLPAA